MKFLRRPLFLRVAEQLEECIRRGEWTNWMPSEKDLAKDLGVSRTTLRQALGKLRDQGLIIIQQGKNSRIARNKITLPAQSLKSQTVTLLSPVPLRQLRQHTLVWIDELRGLLHEVDLSLHVHAGLAPYKGHPEAEVEKLMHQHRSSVWLLLWTNKLTQMAFANLGVPAIVIGATDDDVPLLTASVDNRAITFHAIGQFTSRGHTSLALVTTKSKMGGNRQFESSFNETLSAQENRHFRGRIIIVDEQEPEKLKRALLLVFNQVEPPTGFILVHPLHMLTAYNVFQGTGLKIGRDVSLISAFADNSFDFLTPQPSYYRHDPEVFAKKLFSLVRKVRDGAAGKEDAFSLFPELMPGKSLGWVESEST